MIILFINKVEDAEQLSLHFWAMGMKNVRIIARFPVLEYIVHFLKNFQLTVDHVLINCEEEGSLGFHIAHTLSIALPKQSIILIGAYKLPSNRPNLSIFKTLVDGVRHIKNAKGITP